jgi:triacylglycerol esterase/lipase EstA (alpha/beta hydrolase family)
MNGIDWDDAFDNAGYTAGVELLPDQWAEAAIGFRKTMTTATQAGTNLIYGPTEREIFDLFTPIGPAKGTMVFVHGGYWHKFDKSYWSHLATGALGHNWSVAMPSYPLAPDAGISQITNAIARAVGRIAEVQKGPLVLVGHSAGGHLVSRMICEGVLDDTLTSRIARVVSISGVHHLPPLLATKMNDTLGLTAAEAARESPVDLDPVQGIPVSIVVGDQERPEFLRQSRMLAERWAGKGTDIRTIYDQGTDHFSVITGLAEPDSTLIREILS